MANPIKKINTRDFRDREPILRNFGAKINESIDEINNAIDGISAFDSLTTDAISEKTVGGYIAINSLVKDTVDVGITAFAGGGQGSATALTKRITGILVCASAGDSAKLPTAVVGLSLTVKNLGANYCDIFGATGASIDGGSANAAFRLQPGHSVTFTAASTTAWQSNNTATGTVTQITSITTGVTLNSVKGVITTVAATAGASGATPNIFTVTNSFAQADSHISAYIVDLTGTGNPAVIVDNRTDGTFDIQLSSFSAAALNNVIKIGFEIKN